MNNIRASIDIWNGYIKWIVFQKEEWKEIILAKEIIKTEGYRKGKILDTNLLSNCIHNMIDWFQKKIWGEYIDDIIVWLSHPELFIDRVTEHKRILGTDIIQGTDVSHLSKLIGDISQKNNYEIIKIIPAYWILDEEKIEKNPEGCEAKKLTLVADIFYLPKVFYQNLVDIFHNIHLNVIDIIPNIIASSDTLLDVDHKDLWAILIDIGSNQTSYAVFEEGNAILYGTLPVWWDDVTKDISIWLQIDIKEAEKIKINYEKMEDDNEITLDYKFLHEIMSARYEQIFNKINDALKKIWRDGKLAGGVHLTGQGTLRSESISHAKEIFKLATFYAQNGEKNREIGTNKSFQNSISLYAWSNKYHNKSKWLFSFRGIQSTSKGIIDSITNFFKDLF
jgi:cell division protein FtsA